MFFLFFGGFSPREPSADFFALFAKAGVMGNNRKGCEAFAVSHSLARASWPEQCARILDVLESGSRGTCPVPSGIAEPSVRVKPGLCASHHFLENEVSTGLDFVPRPLMFPTWYVELRPFVCPWQIIACVC